MLLRLGLLYLPIAVTVGQRSTKSHQNGLPDFPTHYPLNPSCDSSPIPSCSLGSTAPNWMRAHLLSCYCLNTEPKCPGNVTAIVYGSGGFSPCSLVRVCPLGDQDIKLHNPEMRGWEAQSLSVINGSNGKRSHLCFHTLVPGSKGILPPGNTASYTGEPMHMHSP